jgi:hypothetical protein
VLRGGGGQGFGSDAELSESPKGYWDLDVDLYRGCTPGWGRGEGSAEQELTDYTDLPLTKKGWMDFYDAAVIHWKWPAIDPQHPRKPREPPPGHAFNVYMVTSIEVWEYATTVMALDKAGARALLAHVGFLWRNHFEWDKKATEAIEKDRRNGGSLDNDKRLLSWNTDEDLWISTQRELAKLHPNRTPKELQQLSQEGYCSMRECGVARDIRSAFTLLERETGETFPLLAELESARELSSVTFVRRSNRASTWDKLLRCQVTYPMAEPTGQYSQHHVSISEQTVGECRNSGAYESIGGTANGGSGPRGQFTGLRQGSGISPGNFIRSQHYLAEQGYRPSSGSSITRLHDSATNTQQDVDKASDGGSEEPSL